jgi:hypothetical protein
MWNKEAFPDFKTDKLYNSITPRVCLNYNNIIINNVDNSFNCIDYNDYYDLPNLTTIILINLKLNLNLILNNLFILIIYITT